MSKIKVTAKTIEDAVGKAAEELDVAAAQVEYEVIEEGGKGLFKAKEVIIEAWTELEDELPADDAGGAEISPFLDELLQKMELPCEVEVLKGEDGVKINLSSPDAAHIIGRKGDTLSALQYLTNIVENKVKSDDFIRYTVDIENYREKRVQALQHMAKVAVAKVHKTGRSVEFAPLNSYERRIVHAYLQEVGGVNSRSIGDEPKRIIVSKA